MYLPIDPNKKPDAWEKLTAALLASSYRYVVEDCHGNLEVGKINKDAEEVRSIVERLKTMDYVRIGTSHLNPVPAHYALRFLENNEKAALCEYIASDSEQSNSVTRRILEHDIPFLVQLSFYELTHLKILELPFCFNFEGDTDYSYKVDKTRNVTEVVALNKL